MVFEQLVTPMLRLNEARPLACRHGEPSISTAGQQMQRSVIIAAENVVAALEEAPIRMAPTCPRAVVTKLDLDAEAGLVVVVL